MGLVGNRENGFEGGESLMVYVVEQSTVVRFRKWLSRLIHAGTRGFYDSELRAVHGEQYQRVMSDWIARGWIEQRDKDKLGLWWVSERGSRALQGDA